MVVTFWASTVVNDRKFDRALFSVSEEENQK
jgi:hypothetical protein